MIVTKSYFLGIKILFFTIKCTFNIKNFNNKRQFYKSELYNKCDTIETIQHKSFCITIETNSQSVYKLCCNSVKALIKLSLYTIKHCNLLYD